MELKLCFLCPWWVVVAVLIVPFMELKHPGDPRLRRIGVS